MVNIDLSAFNDTFKGDNLKAISQFVAEKMAEISDLNKYVTIFDDTVFNTELGFVGDTGLIGKKGFPTGDSIANDDYNLSVRKVTFEPKQWGARLMVDYSNFITNCGVYALKKGCRIADLQDTDIMEVLIDSVARTCERFKWRLFFFNNTQITVSASGTPGDLKENTDKGYFDIIDGLFTQMLKQITVNADQKVTYNGAKIAETLEKVYFNAPVTLKDQDDQIILCTQSFADQYRKMLSSKGELESMLRNLENGKKVLTYQGVELVPIKIWDEILNAYFDTTTSKTRAVFTSKSILGCATDSMDAFKDFNIWYDNYRRQVFIDIAGKADAKLLNPEMFVYCY